MSESIKIPKVSVCVITFNQVKYIRQCLQSIVDQVTDFEFEVIVGDDCSTDGTREIVQEFSERYPEIVKAIYQEKNIDSGCHNYLTVHQAAKGEYIAHVDGDDYCFKDKIMLQANFLDENPDCSLVAHKMRTIDGAGRNREIIKHNPKKFSLEYLMRNHPCFLSSSIMYRREHRKNLLELNNIFLDFHVYILLSNSGSIGFINKSLGFYSSGVGIASKRNLMPYIQSAINLAETQIGDTRSVVRCRSRHYLSYGIAALCANEIDEFRQSLLSAIRADKFWIFPKIIYVAGFMPKILKWFILVYKNRA